MTVVLAEQQQLQSTQVGASASIQLALAFCALQYASHWLLLHVLLVSYVAKLLSSQAAVFAWTASLHS